MGILDRRSLFQAGLLMAIPIPGVMGRRAAAAPSLLPARQEG